MGQLSTSYLQREQTAVRVRKELERSQETGRLLFCGWYGDCFYLCLDKQRAVLVLSHFMIVSE